MCKAAQQATNLAARSLRRGTGINRDLHLGRNGWYVQARGHTGMLCVVWLYLVIYLTLTTHLLLIWFFHYLAFKKSTVLHPSNQVGSLQRMEKSNLVNTGSLKMLETCKESFIYFSSFTFPEASWLAEELVVSWFCTLKILVLLEH